jgi:hypothetical protein
MRPWENTKIVQELDARLHAYGLLPATTPRPKTRTPTTT